MGKKEKLSTEVELDITEVNTPSIPIEKTPELPVYEGRQSEEPMNLKGLISCLRSETITVRYLPKESGMVTNPKHILYGGMSEDASRSFTVPILRSSGQYKNVLTNEEMAFLEEYMGLPNRALSIYKKTIPEQGIFNYWENFTVRLVKGDNHFDLSNPNDFIKYKVLLSNVDSIASSMESLVSNPKATYQFVIISENEEVDFTKKKLNATMEAYRLLGKLETDKKALKLIVETVDGRPISDASKLDFIASKAHDLIQADAKLFVSVASDKYLQTKVLIKEAVKHGLISKRGDYYLLSSNSAPLCENTEEPTLNMASKYLNSPKYQEVKLMLEAKLKSLEE